MSNNSDIRNEDLILYIATKLRNCVGFGSIMLNKILYYSDNIHYQKHGRAISSFSYINQERGPTPAPAEFIPLRIKLIKEGKVREEIDDQYFWTRKKLVPTKSFKPTLFSVDELKVVDEVISKLEGKTATELSDLTHCELGWLLTKLNEQIPLNAYLLATPEFKEDDFTWANKELTKLSLN